jgi:hypothetical protein
MCHSQYLGFQRAVLVCGLLMLLMLTRAAAVELSPELRLPALDPTQPDIRRSAEPPRNVTPRSRPRPEVSPLGARIGPYHLFTRLDLKLSYNDNLFASDERTSSDLVRVLAPAVELRSDWSRHAVKLGGSFASSRYEDFSRENHDNWRVFAEGRLDLGRASDVFGSASVAHEQEDRASPDSTLGAEPTNYQVSEVGAGWRHPFGRFEAQLNGTARDYEFDQINASGLPAGTLEGDDRNRQTLRGEGRLRYSMWPGYGVFLRGAYSTVDYDATAPGGLNRDSDGYETGLGLDLELTDLIFGNAFVGYYRQRYDASGFDTAGGLGFGADISWNVTRLSTLHFEAQRSVQEAVQAGAAGYLSTDLGVELEHELLRNLLLVASSRQVNRRYDGIDRQETLWQHSFGANYLTNRHLQLRLQVVHRQQDGTAGGREFTQTFVEQSIVLQH